MLIIRDLNISAFIAKNKPKIIPVKDDTKDTINCCSMFDYILMSIIK